jgi:hypothetical protein
MPRDTKARDRRALGRIVNMCLKSAAFRRRLENNPAAVLRQLRIKDESGALAKALNRMRWGSLQKLGASFGYDRFLQGRDAN